MHVVTTRVRKLYRGPVVIVRFWTLAMLASIFPEEERDREAPHWQGHVTIGEARRTT